MARRTISIDEASYKILSEFCKERTLVMNAWSEKILMEEIKNTESDKI